MGDKTGIQWTDATWNPIAGCSVLSPACTNCYAMAQAARIQRMAAGNGKPTHYAGTTQEVNGKAVWTGKIVEAPEHIFAAPLRWKKPRCIFVNSMSDLWHENVPDDTLDRIFAVMALCERHTFQPLTKRPERMREYLSGIPSKIPFLGRMPLERIHIEAAGHMVGDGGAMDALKWAGNIYSLYLDRPWPLTNVILGVTVEDQKRADERREAMHALAAMGWRIFVSYEPALGPVDWTGWEFVSQIIVGGESRPEARPMHPDWVRATLAFCRAHGIAFFFKQFGEFAPEGLAKDRWIVRADGSPSPRPTPDGIGYHAPTDGSAFVYRVGKARAGRLLDGKEYSEFPEAR